MMSRWRMLAQIEWRHDYYADGHCRDFVLTPTPEAMRRMEGLRLRSKALDDRFLLLVQVDEENRPVVAFPEDLRLVFHLDLKAASFLTVSNVDEDLLRRNRYHFSNLSGHATGLPANPVYHLSRPLEAFDAARKYRPGDLVLHSGATFECIKMALAEPPDAAASAFWLNRGNARYASPLDLVPIDEKNANAFGVVELFHALSPGHPLAWLNASGQVREITYTVRFANRCAYWKYLTPLRKVDDIRPNVDHAQPSPFTSGSLDPALPAQKDFFLSNQALPLSEVADVHRFDLLLAGEARPAPKPNPDLPGMLTRNFDPVDRVYTDSICTIRLNH